MIERWEYDMGVDAAQAVNTIKTRSLIENTNDPMEAVEGVIGLINGGEVMDLSQVSWDLTRPDTTCVHTEVQHRLDDEGIPPEIKDHVDTLTVTAFFDGDGEILTVMAWGKKDGETVKMDHNIPAHLGQIIRTIFTEEIEKLGYTDPAHSLVEGLGDLFSDQAEKDIDQEVEEFSSKLDDLFETWGGGDTS